MIKKTELEILGPESDHAYNDQTLNSKEFMIAVMHDRRVPLPIRLDAASKVSQFEHPRLAQVAQDMTIGATIRIEGGLPELPGTNIIMPKRDSKPSDKPKSNGSREP